MHITNIHQAKTQLSKLVERVLQGEEIVIGRAGKPVAKLVPYERPVQPRQGGQWRGQVAMEDDFDELPAEIATAFMGEQP